MPPQVWALTGNMSVPRSYFSALLLPNGKVLVAGGYSNSVFTAVAELYDSVSGTWSTTGSLNQGRIRGHLTLLPLSGKVLIAGGIGSSGETTSTELYDPSTGTWTNIPTSGGGNGNVFASDATIDQNDPNVFRFRQETVRENLLTH